MRTPSVLVRFAIGLVLVATVALAAAAPAAQADVGWGITMSHQNVYGAVGKVDPATGSGETLARSSGFNTYTISVTNTGDTPTTGTVTIAAQLPQGLHMGTTTPFAGSGWICGASNGGTAFSCKRADELAAGAAWSGASALTLHISVDKEAPKDSVDVTATVAGGGAAGSATASDPTSIVTVPFGLRSAAVSVKDVSGGNYTQAGGHPFSATTSVVYNQISDEAGTLRNAGNPKELLAEIPPGFMGNPQSAPKCPLTSFEFTATSCPANTAVGWVKFAPSATPATGPVYSLLSYQPVFNLQAPPGQPALFGFIFFGVPVPLEASVRSDGDYGLTVGDTAIGSNVNLVALDLTLCENGVSGALIAINCSKTPVAEHTGPFLTNLTKCQGGEPVTTMKTNIYGDPTYSTAAALSPIPTGCNSLTQNWIGSRGPSLSLIPETGQADTPSGYDVGLHIPQGGLTEAEGLASPHLDNTTVTLPAGVSLSPSAANGLEACTEAEIGLASKSPIHFNEAAPSCPNASKVGTVEVKTPLLEAPLNGAVYLAAQKANPFGSDFAIYLAIDDAKTGITVKLAGKVSPDPQNGQIVATFTENPELPFEDFKLHFFGGSRAALANPQTCGTYTTTSALTPWSAVDPAHPTAAETASPSSSFAVTSMPGGGACATTAGDRPFNPGLNAGTESTTAGASSPFVMHLTRNDGEQEFSSLNVDLPTGFTAKLAGVPYCSNAAIAAAGGKSGMAEQADPSCPAASQVGTLTTGAGPGPNPYYVSGKAYLAGPYKGAPLSLAFITPAVAGPFDLGNVVVRAAVFVNPETAQVSAKTDPIPQILDGVPLGIRSIAVNVDRSGFTQNPTNCTAKSINLTVSGASGATANPSSRFQVGDCDKLGFAPKLALQLKGQTRRIGHPALTAVVTAGPGEANIARAQVNLPHGEFLDQGNLNKTCTKPVLLAGQCPESSVYGYAKAWTPLLDKPLEGNVYLVGGYGYKLPALVAELNGQIKVLLVGKVDSGKNKGIRNTFEVVPDAPVEKFELRMKGGKKYGLLENSENLCKAPKARRRANVFFTGQNGKVEQSKPLVANQCGKGKKGKKKAHK